MNVNQTTVFLKRQYWADTTNKIEGSNGTNDVIFTCGYKCIELLAISCFRLMDLQMNLKGNGHCSEQLL